MREELPGELTERLEGSVHIARVHAAWTEILWLSLGEPRRSVTAGPGRPLESPTVPGPSVPSLPGHRAEPPMKNGLGFTSLLMGILGLTTPWLPFRGLVPQTTLWLPFMGIVFAPLAIIFGIIGIARFSKGTASIKSMALTDLALGVVYLLLLAGAFVFVLVTNTYH
jgi:hypothetical protein